MPRSPRLFLVSFVFLVVAGPAAFAQRLDQLFPVRGTPVTGTISDMSPTEVTMNVRGADQKFSVLDIKRVAFADEPRELTTGRDNILNGDFESGLDQLKRIDGSTISREFVKQELDYYMAYAHAKSALIGGGDKEAASQALFGFARGAPKNFHFIEAAELLGDLAVAREKYDEATRYYGFLSKTAKEAAWAEFDMRVAVLEGRVLEAQAKFPEAIEKYDAVQAATVDSPEANRQKNLARVGKATVLAETGQADEGLKIIEDIVQKTDSQQELELFGRAYNAMGRCYLKAGKSKEAVLAYLHVHVLFNQHPEVHAEALYHLSKLWPTVNRSDRGVEARSVLSERYAGSPWAKRN